MNQSQSVQITSRPVSRPLDAGSRRPGAALLVACALVAIAATLRAEGLRLAGWPYSMWTLPNPWSV